MAISRPSTKISMPNADAFINAAPDGAVSPAVTKPNRKRTMKGKKEQISLTISIELVDKLDAMATKVGQTRAALINMAIYQLINRGMTLEP